MLVDSVRLISPGWSSTFICNLTLFWCFYSLKKKKTKIRRRLRHSPARETCYVKSSRRLQWTRNRLLPWMRCNIIIIMYRTGIIWLLFKWYNVCLINTRSVIIAKYMYIDLYIVNLMRVIHNLIPQFYVVDLYSCVFVSNLSKIYCFW